MKRILLAGVAAGALSMAFIAPVIADEAGATAGKVELVAQDALPKPGELKVQEGNLEGHKKPMEVYLKALKAAKGGDMAGLKGCFQPDSQDYLDEASWESDGDEEQTYLQVMAKILKGYSEEGVLREQGKVGNFAVIAVKNGEAVNMVKLVREGKWTEEGETPKNWYLASYSSSDYRTDYAAPGVKSIKDAIEKGDVAKLKEHLDEWQTKALDLITGVEEGVDGYALLLKRLQKLNNAEVKPLFILNRYDSTMAYWFHSDKGDTFLVLRFMGDTYDWETEKKYTKVQIDISATSDFQKDPAETFKNFVQDWSWD
ncbi:MAG: hypothetical protein K8I27_16185 [Planctomycetes bacterium]|nr:hypothetical protein [Planctomycetota bacterium]